jgi:hypothetical protein
MYDEDIKKIVKKRLLAMPPEISFSVGGFGDFSRDQLINEIDDDSDIGKEIVEMQVNFLKKIPKLLKQ